MYLLSKRKNKEAKKSFLTSKACNLIVMTIIFAFVIMIVPTFAATTLESAKGLLSKAAGAGGTLWAVWGLVQLGIAIKDHNGPGMQGAIWQIVGGAVIIAASALINNTDLSMGSGAAPTASATPYTITEDISRVL